MIVYLVILLLVNTCSSRSFGSNPVPNTGPSSVSTALASLAKSCESPLATLISNKIEECSVASPSHTVKKQFECLLFLDVNNQLCNAIAKNHIVVPKENIMVKITAPVNIERMCTSAKDWKPSVLAAYPQYNATVLKNDMKCAIVCGVEDVTSQDSNFFCKYYKWGMDLLSRSNSVADQADNISHMSEQNPNLQYQHESGSHPGLEQKPNRLNQQEPGLHSELGQKPNLIYQEVSGLEQKPNPQYKKVSSLQTGLEQKLNPQDQQDAGLHTTLEKKLNLQNQQESGLHTGLQQNLSQQDQQESALHYETDRANVASSKDLKKSTEVKASLEITSGQQSQQTQGADDQQVVGSHANSELVKDNSAEEVDSVQQSILANQNLMAKDPVVSSGPRVLFKGQNIAQSESISKNPLNNAESVAKLSGDNVMKNVSALQEQTGQNGNVQSQVNAGADYSDPGDYDSDLDNLVDTEKKINVDKTKQASKTSKGSNIRSFGETDKNIIMPDYSDDDEDHFFSFFLTVIVMVVILYILYHNKNKISKLFFGLLVEGRQSRRRNSRGHAYRRLDTLEQAMSTNSAAPPSKIIY